MPRSAGTKLGQYPVLLQIARDGPAPLLKRETRSRLSIRKTRMIPVTRTSES